MKVPPPTLDVRPLVTFGSLASARLGTLLAKGWGMQVHDGNRRHIERAAATVARDAGLTDVTFIRELEKGFNTPLAQDFISLATIGETYFFRHHEHFHILRDAVVPELMRSQPHRSLLRGWSAACSTGEEAYSMAIALRSCVPPHVQVDVLGTDVNTASLKKAEAGIYGRWSERTEFDDAKMLIRTGDQLKVSPQLKKLVHFSRLNLAEAQYPSVYSNTLEVDVIFCRNVLIYFSSEAARDVLRKLAECLAPGGCLFTSALDVDLAPSHLVRWGFPDSTVILKRPPIATAVKAPASKRPAPEPTPTEAPVPQVYVAEALRLSSAGLNDQAIAHLQDNLRKSPDPSAIVLLTLLLFDEGDEEVLPMLQELVRSYPNFLQGHLHLGFHLQAAGATAEANSCFLHILAELNDVEDTKVLPGPTELPVGYVRRLVMARVRRGVGR